MRHATLSRDRHACCALSTQRDYTLTLQSAHQHHQPETNRTPVKSRGWRRPTTDGQQEKQHDNYREGQPPASIADIISPMPKAARTFSLLGSRLPRPFASRTDGHVVVVSAASSGTTSMSPRSGRRLYSDATLTSSNHRPQNFSSVAVAYDSDDDEHNIRDGIGHHHQGFTRRTPIGNPIIPSYVTTATTPPYPCGNAQHEDEQFAQLPPPLPEPKYSVHKRVLPSNLIAFSSPEGRQMLVQSIQDGHSEPYWKLTEQFVNQSDPAYCGITTLLMCLNALSVDPNIRWKGGWRFYATEDVLLSGCCLSKDRILRVGIVLEVFGRLAKCHGLGVELKRATIAAATPAEAAAVTQCPAQNSIALQNSKGTDHSFYSLDDFRADIRNVMSDKDHNPLLVVSFSRQALQQTGDGHFSPVAAYHEETDQVLVLDVARFKYTPYWVPIKDLYRAMQEVDAATGLPRGWFVLRPPKNHLHTVVEEDRRPVEAVPFVGEDDVCPVGSVKVEFCEANPKWDR